MTSQNPYDAPIVAESVEQPKPHKRKKSFPWLAFFAVVLLGHYVLLGANLMSREITDPASVSISVTIQLGILMLFCWLAGNVAVRK